MPLILDKITTPPEAPRISRSRLLSTLHGSLQSCTSTIINGRAGTGKTLLAADFARRCGRAVAWYKIDASDTELHVFFNYLVATVGQHRPGFGEQTLLPMVEGATLEDIPVLAEAFVYELLETNNNEPLLIVLDDLHLVYDAEWVVPFFRRLLPLLPAEAHMLITGRSLPPAPLWRMRSKQTLCVVEETVMAFTLKEAEKLFASYHLAEDRAEGALRQARGRASVLDALARLWSENENEETSGKPAQEKRGRKPRVRQTHGYAF
ncbi:MAG TPA: AAA family ATPase [Pyrinomonadaceae bacterium]|jgi:LuxR family maltose regulon positive regulatory protein